MRLHCGHSFAFRFWSQVEKTDTCWHWIGATDCHGYGRIRSPFGSESAHRASWEIHNGEIPSGMEVCHSCDTPSCVNPAHLFLGTHAENMRDMAKKGRTTRVLSAAQVKEIKQALKAGVHQTRLASSYGVTKTAITEIKHGRTWRHV